jgi:hypothetical protein
MKPDTHLGENARQIEVSDDQTTPFLSLANAFRFAFTFALTLDGAGPVPVLRFHFLE